MNPNITRAVANGCDLQRRNAVFRELSIRSTDYSNFLKFPLFLTVEILHGKFDDTFEGEANFDNIWIVDSGVVMGDAGNARAPPIIEYLKGLH